MDEEEKLADLADLEELSSHQHFRDVAVPADMKAEAKKRFPPFWRTRASFGYTSQDFIFLVPFEFVFFFFYSNVALEAAAPGKEEEADNKDDDPDFTLEAWQKRREEEHDPSSSSSSSSEDSDDDDAGETLENGDEKVS